MLILPLKIAGWATVQTNVTKEFALCLLLSHLAVFSAYFPKRFETSMLQGQVLQDTTPSID